jgi:hypothetical protein
VFGPFGRPAHVAGSPALAVGAAHQMLPIGKTLPIGQMLPIGKTLPIRQMLPIGKMLPILPAPGICASPILPAPGICASAHDSNGVIVGWLRILKGLQKDIKLHFLHLLNSISVLVHSSLFLPLPRISAPISDPCYCKAQFATVLCVPATTTACQG